MRFLIDAHLPRKACSWFAARGCDAMHTLDLPMGNRTSDAQISLVADRDARIVVTKDADFVDSHLLSGRPAKLLLISTGNLDNEELQSLLGRWLGEITAQFQNATFIELHRRGITLRS